MAVIKLSPFTTAISGSMKNLTFSSTKDVTIMKSRETGANPNTAAQSTARNYFGRSSKGYALLTPTELLSWKAYAEKQVYVGKTSKEPYVPNAFQAYKKLTNVWYAANGGVGTPPSSAPTTAFAGDVITLSAAASGSVVTISASAASAPNVVVEVWLQPLRNANRKPSAKGFRVRGYLTFTGTGLSKTISVTPGSWAAQYRFVNKATGQAGPMASLPVTGVALGLVSGDEAEAPTTKRKAA